MIFAKEDKQKTIFNGKTMHYEKIEEKDIVFVPKQFEVSKDGKMIKIGGRFK